MIVFQVIASLSKSDCPDALIRHVNVRQNLVIPTYTGSITYELLAIESAAAKLKTLLEKLSS
jgi:hypothetical protein